MPTFLTKLTEAKSTFIALLFTIGSCLVTVGYVFGTNDRTLMAMEASLKAQEETLKVHQQQCHEFRKAIQNLSVLAQDAQARIQILFDDRRLDRERRQ